MLAHLQPPQPPARVLLLGAAGFFASRIRGALMRRGVAHRAVGRAELDLSAPGAGAALAALIRPEDAVVMAAGITPDRGKGIPALMANLRMAEAVVEALERAPCRHFVYISSEAVYDADKVPLDEESSREPVDLYALTHTAREMMLASALDPSETPYCIVRPTNIYGPGDSHANYGPNRFVRSAVHEGKIVLFGHGEERRSHLFIEDMVELIRLILERRSRGALNLAYSPALSFLQIAKLVQARCPRPVQLEFQPRTVAPIHRPYKPTQIFRYLSRLGRRVSPIVHRPFAVRALSQAFPDFRYTPIEDGLARFIAEEQSAASR